MAQGSPSATISAQRYVFGSVRPDTDLVRFVVIAGGWRYAIS